MAKLIAAVLLLALVAGPLVSIVCAAPLEQDIKKESAADKSVTTEVVGSDLFAFGFVHLKAVNASLLFSCKA